MSFSQTSLAKVMSGSQPDRVEALRQLLGYPLKERDAQGSRFWFIRPGANEEEAQDTCPIAVGFYAELDQEPVMIVIGNPPYSGHSANSGEWIGGILRDYYQVDGHRLGEKNPKWLQDDYVKFIRFGQWRIQQTGYGILAFVTNHGYLDNPTFRGMRQSLQGTFDWIRVLDLHGNSKKKEKAPDGSKDESVFDIQQGVSICLMVKDNPKCAT